MLSFLPGEVPHELGEFQELQLTQASTLLRSFHDATLGFEDARGTQVVCHGDPSPCNCVFRLGLPYAFIDFDTAYVGDRAADLGYAAWLWLDIGNPDLSAEYQRMRLRRFFHDYGIQDFDGHAAPRAAVLAAQTRQLLDPSLPTEVRRWSEDCLEWTEHQELD